jgi:phage terminase large subunit-like protein
MDVRATVQQTLTKAGYVQPEPNIIGPVDPIEWIEAEFFIPELSGPIVLQPYQRAVLREAYRRDKNGDFVYSTIIWGDIKKSAKSTIAAAVALERARSLKWGRVRIVANDLKQADSRVGDAMRKAILLNPRLGSRVKISGKAFKCPNFTTIEAVPIDPTGEAGGGDDFIVFSELWGAKSAPAARMWTETTLSPLKMGRSQRWVETYAGFEGESVTLQKLYNATVKEGRNIGAELGFPDLEVFSNESARMLCLWNTIRRSPWQLGEKGDAYYAQEAAALTDSEFDRVHGNMWQSSQKKFVPDEWWNACGVPPAQIPELDRYGEIVVGIDAAVSNDCFGIVAVSRQGDKVIKRYARKWQPTKGAKLEYSNPNDPNDPEYPEGALRWLAKRYNVIVFGYDEYQLHHLANILRADNVGFFLKFDQGADRLTADKQFYDVIRERRFVHDNDADLTEHVQNANRKEDPESRKLRIVKRADELKIDLAVCASTATNLAFTYLPE